MPTTTATQPCLRYRAWLRYSGRVSSADVPTNIYGAAYIRESGRLYSEWLANAYRNYKKDGSASLPYHGTPDPDFDAWLTSIYL
jgi:hypothetical protein